jgi:hypothetical protein
MTTQGGIQVTDAIGRPDEALASSRQEDIMLAAKQEHIDRVLALLDDISDARRAYPDSIGFNDSMDSMLQRIDWDLVDICGIKAALVQILLSAPGSEAMAVADTAAEERATLAAYIEPSAIAERLHEEAESKARIQKMLASARSVRRVMSAGVVWSLGSRDDFYLESVVTKMQSGVTATECYRFCVPEELKRLVGDREAWSRKSVQILALWEFDDSILSNGRSMKSPPEVHRLHVGDTTYELGASNETVRKVT